MAKNNLYQQMELSWGHNDSISNILNKRLQDETKIKVLVMLHQYWKRPNLVLAVTSEIAALFEVSWCPLWYSLSGNGDPEALLPILMMASPSLPTE